jgi:hypothetical protein
VNHQNPKSHISPSNVLFSSSCSPPNPELDAGRERWSVLVSVWKPWNLTFEFIIEARMMPRHVCPIENLDHDIQHEL